MYHTDGRKTQKTSPVPIKRDQPREQDEQKSVGEDRRDEKGAAHVREKEVARTHFSGGFTAARYVCMYVREFEQLNHRNFISVRRPRNITVRSVAVARDFGSGPAPPAQNFFHPWPQTILKESEETPSLIGREESSVDINGDVAKKKAI